MTIPSRRHLGSASPRAEPGAEPRPGRVLWPGSVASAHGKAVEVRHDPFTHETPLKRARHVRVEGEAELQGLDE